MEPSKFLLKQLRALKRDQDNLELAHDVGVQAVHEGFDDFGRQLMRAGNKADVVWELKHLPWERVRITSNHQWRDFVDRYDVPQAVLDAVFDYLDQFMRAPHGMFPGDWDGYLNDSMSTGVVIRVSDDGEQYQVGYFVS